MSLFKQISIIMSLFLLVIIISVMTLNFSSAQKYAQEELMTNVQNSASTLALSLAVTEGKVGKMSTMIDAVFDSGYFKTITLTAHDGKILYTKNSNENETEVPEWFINTYGFTAPIASVDVSSGWKPIGILQITALEDMTYIQLYENFKDLLKTSLIIAIITFIVLFFLLRLVLSSLNKLQEQAEAICDNSFIISDEIPYTTEFKKFTIAMNKMVVNVKTIFEKEAESLQNYHKLLYKDELTQLGNRNFFELKLNDFLGSTQADSSGSIITLFFDGLHQANKSVGHDEVDKLIVTFARKIQTLTHEEHNAIISRIDGTKISIILSENTLEDIEDLADSLLAEIIMLIEKSHLRDEEISVKIVTHEYSSKDTVSDILQKIEKSFYSANRNSITLFPSNANIEEQLSKKTVENRIKENAIAVATQEVMGLENTPLHSEAYVRIFDENEKLYDASDFIPLVHKMRLDTKLDKNMINKVIHSKTLQNKAIAINISLAFIQDEDALTWLEERAASIKDIELSFELSNHALLNSINDGMNFVHTLRECHINFGIDRFTLEEGINLNYLQMLKPSYIKMNCHYLNDLLHGKNGAHSNGAFLLLVESLDINVIATNIEDKKIKESLEKVGIKYFQGSAVSKTNLIDN